MVDEGNITVSKTEAAEKLTTKFRNVMDNQKEEIHVSSTELGRGGWAEVKVAEFHSTQVAAKCFYRELSSKYYEQMFVCEMKVAS